MIDISDTFNPSSGFYTERARLRGVIATAVLPSLDFRQRRADAIAEAVAIADDLLAALDARLARDLIAERERFDAEHARRK